MCCQVRGVQPVSQLQEFSSECCCNQGKAVRLVNLLYRGTCKCSLVNFAQHSLDHCYCVCRFCSCGHLVLACVVSHVSFVFALLWLRACGIILMTKIPFRSDSMQRNSVRVAKTRAFALPTAKLFFFSRLSGDQMW